jgi:hypothetical protein
MTAKKIYDREKVLAGLTIFAILVTFPFWYNMGKAAPAPKPELTKEAKEAKVCVRPTAYMKAEHMQLLDVWRDTVVRDGKRMYVNEEGKSFNMSLSNTCLECHHNKEKFCDACHTYASADPYCYDCHIDNPKEKE